MRPPAAAVSETSPTLSVVYEIPSRVRQELFRYFGGDSSADLLAFPGEFAKTEPLERKADDTDNDNGDQVEEVGKDGYGAGRVQVEIGICENEAANNAGMERSYKAGRARDADED